MSPPLQTKSICQSPSGELHPLPIPNAPWDTASVDFIMELLESNRKDAIMVIVDFVTKWSHFMSTVTTLSATGTAQLYLRHIWKHHSLPKRVVSDRGPQFVAEFTKELYWLLRVKLAATTTYPPQGDRQTERINQELKQFLCLFINQRQDDWDDLLPFTEFQYNNHIHSATQNVPFLLDTGQIPHMGFEKVVIWTNVCRSHVESVNEFKERMEDTLKEAKAALVKSKDDMEKCYDRRRTPAPEYQAGDRVYLDASKIHTTRPSWKLSHQRLGPFLVIRKVGNGAYCLCLPPSMSRLHPAFNVIKLTLAPEDPVPGQCPHPPPLPEIINGEEEFIMEEILDSRCYEFCSIFGYVPAFSLIILLTSPVSSILTYLLLFFYSTLLAFLISDSSASWTLSLTHLFFYWLMLLFMTHPYLWLMVYI